MEDPFRYAGDLSGGSLMVRESRIIAGLLLDDLSPEQWQLAIGVENVLQKRSPTSAKRNAITIRKRLELLEPAFCKALRDGDDELAAQVTFCGALERNLLLLEFMETTLRDAYATRAESLDTFIWLDFLAERSQRDSSLKNLKESTQKKMGQVVFRMLAEVGYLKSTKQLALQRLLLRSELKVLLELHDKARIKNCLQVSVWTR